MKNWMKQTGVWIDNSQAIIVTLFDGGENIKEIKNRIYEDDKSSKEIFSNLCQESIYFRNQNYLNNNHTEHFILDVLTQVKDSDELYIFGPSDAKTKLQRKIYDEHFIDFRKLKSVKFSTKLNLNEILANVREFYKN